MSMAVAWFEPLFSRRPKPPVRAARFVTVAEPVPSRPFQAVRLPSSNPFAKTCCVYELAGPTADPVGTKTTVAATASPMRATDFTRRRA